jgi:hypothetical protein
LAVTISAERCQALNDYNQYYDGPTQNNTFWGPTETKTEKPRKMPKKYNFYIFYFILNWATAFGKVY